MQHVERWGVPGDKQDGIDFFGRFNDGTPAAWQVKQLEKLTRGVVRDAVRATTFDKADELYLVFGGIATVQARKEMLTYPNWTLLDRRTLTEMLRILPTQTQHDIVERFWGAQVRRQFVAALGDAMIPFDRFLTSRQNPASIINDLGQLAGREDELDRLASELDGSHEGAPQILVISGPGGRGKTRLWNEALCAVIARDPSRVISCLAPNWTFDVSAMRDLHSGTDIVVIDDAHNDPSALDPLLAFARSHSDLRIILATRPSGLPSIQGAIARASFAPDDQLLISLNELSLSAARKLVAGLTSGLDLSFGLRNYLAEQARHSPHIAVILTNLIRRGQVSGAIAVNANLRRVVLSRYQEVMVPSGFEGFDSEMVHRVIATYACVQPDASELTAERARIADFCKLSLLQLSRLTKQLIDCGILIDTDGRLRVVPDVLADQIVEGVAVFADFDTGFVSELWQSFGPNHYQRLTITLGELDWRVSQRGGPAVMAAVWNAIRTRLDSPHPAALTRELDQIAPLAATQPAALVAAIEDVRIRLDRDDVWQVPEVDDARDADEQLHRRIWPGSRYIIGRSDVRAKLPRLYGRAAIYDSSTLETAVDALLALACVDSRPPHSHPDHPSRVLSDELCNLATLPDHSYATRIVARVESFISSHSDAEAVVALSALKPLLAKEVVETTQFSHHQLSFTPHLISATEMRLVRDHIRALLVDEASSNSLLRAGAAIELLRQALRAPHGYFGNAVSADAVLTWEDDDLATLDTLTQAAARTPYATIRRMIRGAIDWNAKHAQSLLIQHAALSLQHELDISDNLRDALADYATGLPWQLASEKVEYVPDLAELKTRRDARRAETEGLSEQEQRERRQAASSARIAAKRARISTVNSALAQRLLNLGTAAEILAIIGDVSVESQGLGKQQSFYGIWQAIGDLQAPIVPDLVRMIASTPEDHPLDQDLPVLITQWSGSAMEETLAWAAGAIVSSRTGVRLALATFVNGVPWTQNQEVFLEIWRTGIADPDIDIATAFLGSSGWYLHTNPRETSAMLLAHDVPPRAAANALMGAWSYDNDTGQTERDQATHSALLSIAARAGLNDFIAQEVVTTAARAHPKLALDFLLDTIRKGEKIDDGFPDLHAAFEKNVDEFSDWLIEHLHDGSDDLGEVVSAALSNQLLPDQAASLTSMVPGLRSNELIIFVRVLGSLRLWVPSNLALADACVNRAESDDVLDDVLPELQRGMRLNTWGWVGNESSELNAARDACAAAAEKTTSTYLCSQLSQAADWFQQIIDELRYREREEDW
ncbi:ATP-binding protein [Corynebacterium atrinae]|uniref:ATP-binding protein n=1 Tax=Corynebacterium atrinae TaxID=1336740 RepID=UPI0025B3B894|nr:ATP-binding protein [Corynebacterium atrinae]